MPTRSPKRKQARRSERNQALNLEKSVHCNEIDKLVLIEILQSKHEEFQSSDLIEIHLVNSPASNVLYIAIPLEPESISWYSVYSSTQVSWR